MILWWAGGGVSAFSAEDHGEEGHGGATSELLWKSLNFALIAAGIGYLLYRKGGPFFRAQRESIRKDIEEANRLRREAEQRAAEMERRLAGLEAEIESLRRQASGEMAAENERLRRQTEAALEKIRRQAEQEIEGASKAARHEVRTYAAGLAAELAASKLRTSLDAAADDALVGSFLEELKRTRGSAPKELN